MEERADVFRAVAHPVRRAIVEHLVAREGDRDPTVESGELADLVWIRFRLMWPSTSRHLRVLREAGIVSSTVRGPCRLYRLERAALAELAAWIDAVGT